MSKIIFKILLVVGILLGYSRFLVGQDVELILKNQVNTWSTVNFQNPLFYQFGGRYIPELSIGKPFKKEQLFDVEISANAYTSFDFQGWNHLNTSAKINPYRAWVRYSNNKLEIRAGLQKINFGSASLLRPLMWFDQIDPRDPLQLTDGVYALLGKYYFKNNANLWLWFLIGNDNPKGWDLLPSMVDKPEYGGRIQLPISAGEAAFSFHHRTADYSMLNPDTTFIGSIPKAEDKIALDGKWDIGVGIWYEIVLKNNGLNNEYTNTWEDYINIGIDYTFGLGNGLNVIGEFFRLNSSGILFGKGKRAHFSAVSASYPTGMIGHLNIIMFMNWDNFEWYRFINFQQTYDNLTLNFMAFWNPDNYNLYNLSTERTLYAGKGIQILAVWNF